MGDGQRPTEGESSARYVGAAPTMYETSDLEHQNGYRNESVPKIIINE